MRGFFGCSIGLGEDWRGIGSFRVDFYLFWIVFGRVWFLEVLGRRRRVICSGKRRVEGRGCCGVRV